MKNHTSSRLTPSLGLFDATSIGLGAIIGGGIYVVTGIVAGLAGPALILSIILAATISLFSALSFVQLTAWKPLEGSVYAYTRILVSPSAGFLAGWMWAAANIFSGAAVALGFGHYCSALLPTIPVRPVAVLLCLLLAVLNYRGVKSSAAVNNILVTLKLLSLLIFILAGLTHFRSEHFVPFVRSKTGILYGAVFIFFAFTGFARVAVIGQEVKEPKRTIPRSMMLALGISTGFYIAVGIAALGLLGSKELAGSNSPLSEAIRTIGHPLLLYIVSLGGLVAMASVLLTSILGVSRMTFAMAEAGDLPSQLARIHHKYHTPFVSVLGAGILIAIIVLWMPLAGVVSISAFASLFCYGLANASALRLDRKASVYPKIIPIAGIATCLLLLVLSPSQAIFAGLVCLGAGIIFYWIKKKFRKATVRQRRP